MKQVWKYGETVRAIFLNDNAIAELPDRICGLPCLTALHLERNKLARLPYGLHRLSALTALSLADNLLYDPPQVPVTHYPPGTEHAHAHARRLHAPRACMSCRGAPAAQATRLLCGLPAPAAPLAAYPLPLEHPL